MRSRKKKKPWFPLLPTVVAWRAGQFGTRLQGGKDAASARYIFTRLEPITRVLFHEADDKLLAYLSEEGQSIEPQWCARQREAWRLLHATVTRCW